MLVLSRKKSQVINIGPDITVMVVEIVGNRVRLGIKAPEHLAVDREEITQEIKRTGDRRRGGK